MPAQETTYRFETAVLWEFSGYDRNGQPAVDSPSELIVRWVDTEQQVRDSKGNDVTIVAEVHTNTPVAVGSRMWRGSLEDWYGAGSAGQDTGVMQVISYKDTPDVKARARYKAVSLARYKDVVD